MRICTKEQCPDCRACQLCPETRCRQCRKGAKDVGPGELGPAFTLSRYQEWRSKRQGEPAAVE